MTKDEDEFGDFVDFDGDTTRNSASVGAAGLSAGLTGTPPPAAPHSQNPEVSTYFGALPPPDMDNEEDLSDIPPSLIQNYDSAKRTIFERRVPQVRYLITKAKFRWLLAEHELLLDELDTVRKEEERMRASVDAVMDKVLIKELGPEAADPLVGELRPLPPENYSYSVGSMPSPIKTREGR